MLRYIILHLPIWWAQSWCIAHSGHKGACFPSPINHLLPLPGYRSGLFTEAETIGILVWLFLD